MKATLEQVKESVKKALTGELAPQVGDQALAQALLGEDTKVLVQELGTMILAGMPIIEVLVSALVIGVRIGFDISKLELDVPEPKKEDS